MNSTKVCYEYPFSFFNFEVIFDKHWALLRNTVLTSVLIPNCKSVILQMHNIISGIRRDVARFSQLSGLMFQFNLDSQTWVQMKLPERPKHQRYLS